MVQVIAGGSCGRLKHGMQTAGGGASTEIDLRDAASRLAVGVHAPFAFVSSDLFGSWVLFLVKEGHRELTIAIGISRGVVQGNIVLKNLGDSRLFKNRLPGTFGLTSAAIYTFVGMDIELVGELLPIVANVFVDAIDGTDADASGINTITAKPSYSPRHVYR
jgi:hypothetical protein